MQLHSTFICPKCAYQVTEAMPTDASQMQLMKDILSVFGRRCSGSPLRAMQLPNSSCNYVPEVVAQDAHPVH
jgi:hypothetical protein